MKHAKKKKKSTEPDRYCIFEANYKYWELENLITII